MRWDDDWREEKKCHWKFLLKRKNAMKATIGIQRRGDVCLNSFFSRERELRRTQLGTKRKQHQKKKPGILGHQDLGDGRGMRLSAESFGPRQSKKKRGMKTCSRA